MEGNPRNLFFPELNSSESVKWVNWCQSDLQHNLPYQAAGQSVNGCVFYMTAARSRVCCVSSPFSSRALWLHSLLPLSLMFGRIFCAFQQVLIWGRSAHRWSLYLCARKRAMSLGHVSALSPLASLCVGPHVQLSVLSHTLPFIGCLSVSYGGVVTGRKLAEWRV